MTRARLALALGSLLGAFLVAPSATAPTQAATSAVPGHPAVVEARTIGHTVRGQSIIAWRLGQPGATVRVVVLAAMHGDETGPSRILLNLANGRPVRGVDMWVVPYYNRDGVDSHTRQNAHHVDLNRNWPYHWVRLTGEYDSGPRAASEPETQAVKAFLTAFHPRYVVSFHQPLYGVGRGPTKGNGLVSRLHTYLGLPVKSFNCSGVCHGTLTEWYNHYFPGVAITVEYGRALTARQAAVTGPSGLLRSVGATR